ncbi:unnamed protein product [Rotaria socialis]|uniref:JmjC domain-containing protein n=1 Tax=Rotaria socialis TaxID=392032 RepID=A0A820P7H4_9BILA|nr:unnamed protein product [Rotaria socialis]CAF3339319.1 unnamed protein product [Rotaria socialis]CAF4143206.1 unnamed protein product [Rotaria socialis]CAF4398700.1 unnamed protein product [Rotaria socialis]
MSMMTAAPEWNVPYVFKGATIIDDTHSWTGGRRLANLFNEKLLSFRLGKRQKSFFGDRVQFEKDCNHIQATINDFLSWTTSIDNNSLPIDHPLYQYSNKEYFAYADYMHLPELFENDDQHPLIHMIKWSDIGLKDRSGKESTLWIGSQGSHTPCHYDTYGINFVAQIVGKKRWLLFPPESPIGQLQTRIPYEESSVYIDVEPSVLDKFKDIDVYDVTLEPGDVLFVPKHWWHFVSSLDTITISVNSWLEQPDDHVERIKEMLVRQIITSTMLSHDYPCDQWLNHNEIATDPATNLTLLSSLLANTDVQEPTSKRSRNIITTANHVNEQRLTSTLFGSIGLTPSNDNVSSDASDDEILLKRLLKAMTASDTIDLIYNKLLSA